MNYANKNERVCKKPFSIKEVGGMKKFTLIGILLVLPFIVLAGVIEISIYKYDKDTSQWKIVKTVGIYATAEGSFTTQNIGGNINGFVPLSKNWWNPTRIKWSVNIPQSFVGTTSFNQNLRTHVYGKWVTDDVFLMFRSNDTLNVGYSVKGTNIKGNSAYYQAKMDNSSAPSSNFKNWNKVNNQPQTSNMRVGAGNHSFHLWWGFDIAKNRNVAFKGIVIFFDTYIVPDI